jgi:hypothetical protein
MESASGGIRDNVISSNAGFAVKTDALPTVVHHNVVFGSIAPFDTTSGREPATWSNLVVDPLLVAADAGDYALAQTAAGDAAQSPAVDAGSGAVEALDVSGSTRTDGEPDADTADPVITRTPGLAGGGRRRSRLRPARARTRSTSTRRPATTRAAFTTRSRRRRPSGRSAARCAPTRCEPATPSWSRRAGMPRRSSWTCRE